MNNAPRPNITQKASNQFLLTLVIVTALAVLGFAIVLTNTFSDPLYFVGLGILFLLLLTSAFWINLMVHATFALNNEGRRKTLEAANPGAVLVHVVITVPVLRQFRELAVRLGMPRPKLRARSYVTLVADSENLTFYGSANPPITLLVLPTSSLNTAELTTTAAGKKQLPSIRLTFAAMPEAPLVLVPVYWPGVSPKPVPRDALEAQIAAITAAQR
ncbi:MAG: hypothetical protein ABJB03_13075 [Rhodoglobus sp.]